MMAAGQCRSPPALPPPRQARWASVSARHSGQDTKAWQTAGTAALRGRLRVSRQAWRDDTDAGRSG
jgi:hypothetical protein